jgi:tetratricopeptide (TPR) repeat protein
VTATAASTSRPRYDPPRSAPWIIPVAAVLVSLIVFAAFIPALSGEFLDWDDRRNFLDNPKYRGLAWPNIRWMFSTFHMGHYQPLSWLTLGLDYVLWGLNPRGYHLTNNLLHALNAALVLLLALTLMNTAIATPPRSADEPLQHAHSGLVQSKGARRADTPSCEGGGEAVEGTHDLQGGSISTRAGSCHRPLHLILAAAGAALLFGLHPMRVESVAWITERRDLVSASLLLLTVLAYLRAVDPRRSAGRRRGWFIAAVVLFALSLLGKIAGVPLPLVLLALDWYPLRRWSRREAPAVRHGAPGPKVRGTPRRLAACALEKIPFLALSIAFAVNGSLGQSRHDYLMSLAEHGVASRLLICFYGLVFYAWKTLWPAGLLPLYELRFHAAAVDSRLVVAPVIVAASLIALCVIRRRWRAPGAALIVAAVSYAALLAPVLGLFQNGPQIVADRYSYLSTIGMAIVAGAGLLAGACRRGAAARAATMAAGALVLSVLGVRTWQQCSVWRNSESLWSHVYRHDPDSAYGHHGVGLALARRGQHEEALDHFRAALRLHPHFRTAHITYWRELQSLGRRDELDRALREAAASTRYLLAADARVWLGLSAGQRPDGAAAAEQEFRAALAIHPRCAQAHLFLGMVLDARGELEPAARHLRDAARLDPSLIQNVLTQVRASREAGDTVDAAKHARLALIMDPDSHEARSLLDELDREGGT